MDITQLFVNVLLAVLPTAISAGGAVLVRHLATMRRNTAFKLLTNIAFAAVQTAEEMGHSLNIKGPEKLAQAVSTLQGFAAQYRIKVNSDQAHQLVLSALTELRAAEKALTAPPLDVDVTDEELREALYGEPEPAPEAEKAVVVPVTVPALNDDV